MAPMDKVIDTGRLILRRFHEHDVEAFFQLCSRPAVIRYAQSTPVASLEEARELMKAAPFRDYATHGYGRFACVWKESGEVIGFSGLKYVPEIGDTELGYRFFPEPSLEVEGVLKRTLVLQIFQEQVMQLAVVAAGFTPGEADQLRRAMAAWKRKGGLGHFEERLIRGMRERGYAEEFARQIFRQILGFGEYGFPESHAASFALLVYVSAWLKCHEPAAFVAALLNSQPMGFYAPSQLVQDARRHGVEVRAADARSSDWDCTLERRQDGAAALRLGLRLVKGLSRPAALRLAAARGERRFESVQDLAERAGLEPRELGLLAAAGVLGVSRAIATARRGTSRELWHQCRYYRSRASPRAFRCCVCRARGRTSSLTTRTRGSRCAVIRSPSCARDSKLAGS